MNNEIENKFKKILSSCKEEKNQENLIFLDIKDCSLAKVLVAWQKINVHVNFDIDVVDYKNDWEWIWQFSNYNIEDLAIALNIGQNDTIKSFQQAKILKMIYPDGTVNETAIQMVRMLIKNNVNKVTPKSVAKKND